MSTALSSVPNIDLQGHTGVRQEGLEAVSASLRLLLADLFALYLKTKGFHWHVSGSHFRDYHLLFDAQASQILAATDPVAERARKLGCATLHSIGDLARNQRLADQDQTPGAVEMLDELKRDNAKLVGFLNQLHDLCDQHRDVATASLVENWIDEAEERIWFLTEAGHQD